MPHTRAPAGELENTGDEDNHAERDRQKHFPAKPHQLIVAIPWHEGFHHGDQEKDQANLQNKPYRAGGCDERRKRYRRQPTAEEQNRRQRVTGCPSWTLIEPCALRRSLILGESWKTFERCSWPHRIKARSHKRRLGQLSEPALTGRISRGRMDSISCLWSRKSASSPRPRATRLTKLVIRGCR
jgi:hypothetical protein